MTGDVENNKLFAAIGDDTITGGPGDDLLTGADGKAVFALIAGDCIDIVTDFTSGEYVIDLSGTDTVSISQLDFTKDAEGNTAISTGSCTFTLQGVAPGEVSSAGFLFSTIGTSIDKIDGCAGTKT